ncbi:hypothetical protein AJ79_08858 [Helicocarpus griseus UAMH5409]|uniref:DUF7357 domain-containing protein n=1 Tax=Helicocarpus griseus UAMH5409 TaxID=1447875 RepID=A0A2B7WPG7_9EURO|nr:hypothetical protein AJ79_08858 [Helicocarpus griseus UAMH5409]
MRLHLVIQRHGLPTTRVLWTTSSPSTATSNANSTVSSFATVSSSTLTSTRAPNAGFGAGAAAAASGSGGLTIAQLLEEVNEVIPLETQVDEGLEGGGGLATRISGGAGQWGLEDYTVEVMGFECLHFMEVDGLLRDGDEVVIRALQLNDLMARRLTGRHQITADGRHLIDGVPFGKPYISKAASSRPPITIPPRKKRRLNFGGWRVDDTVAMDYGYGGEGDDGEGNVPDWNADENATGRELVLANEDADEDEDDEDFEYESESESESEDSDAAPSEEAIGVAPEEHTEEQPVAEAKDTSPEVHPSKRRAAKKTKEEISAEQPTAEPKIEGILDRKQKLSTSPKRKLSVSFEDQPDVHSEKSVSPHQPSSDSDSVSSSDSDESSDEDDSSSISSSDSSSSEDSSEESTSSDESSSSASSKVIERPTKKAQQTVVIAPQPSVHPPGAGSRKTKNTNRRTKLRRKLQKLKELKILGKDANFDDLRKWCAANPGPVPGTPNKEITETQVDANEAKEQSEFEKKRAQLLRDLAKGGVDVSPRPVKDTTKLSPPQSMSATPLSAANGTPGSAADSSKRQSKLDVASSRRLLFGSLGLKTPKTKEDEEALREKLASQVPPPKPRPVSSAAEVDGSAKEKAESIENWQDRLILQATECVYDNIQLTTPHFPFVQRWDKAAQEAIRECKGNQQVGGKKRKRKSRNYQDDYYEYNDQEWWDGEQSYSNDHQYDGADEHQDFDQYGEAGIVHGDVNRQQSHDMDGISATLPDKTAFSEDLPNLPEDMSTLKDAKESDVKPGAIIAFKKLDMSKATNWQPLVSEYYTAVVENVLDGTIILKLAHRDREQPQEENYEGDDQKTRYSGFEMPGYDENGEDDGIREMQFGEFIEPKLLSAGASYGSVEVVEETQKQNQVAAELLPPIPEVVTVSSQTRQDISTMIREAGFRSGFDSDFLPPEETFFTAQGSINHDDGHNDNTEDNEAASSPVESPTFAGFPSSPPPNPSATLNENHSLPATSSSHSPKASHEKHVTTEVPSSLAWLDGATFDPSFLKPVSDHPKSSALSDDQLQYLESNGAAVQDFVTAAKETGTSQLESHIDDTNIEAGGDTGDKPADEGVENGDDARGDPVQDSVQDNVRARSSPALLSSPPAHATIPPCFQLDQGAMDQDLDDSQFSIIPPTVEDSQPPEYRPASSDSMITNPFYETDRAFPPISPPTPRFTSTAPPRTTTADAAKSPPAFVTRINQRKILSSPRQQSPSPKMSQAYDDRVDLPSIPEADKESTQHSEYKPMSSQPQESSYVVDLTISSDLESPGNSDGDFAASQGLPKGPGWVKKRGGSVRRGRRTAASSEPTRRRGLRRRSVI